MRLTIAALITFLINLPFGYWRDNVKKFSTQWILAIHIAVLLVFVERILIGIGFAFMTYPVIVGAFFLDNLTGEDSIG